MKKVLFATTALVLTAGFASAEMTLSGEANMGLKYDEGGLAYAGKDAAAWYEIDFNVNASGETDGGLTFGAEVDLDTDSVGDGTYAGTVYISGAYGKLTIGAVDPAADDIGLPDIGFDGIGVDNVAETSAYTGTADARWDYTMGDFGVVVSVDTVTESYGLGLSYGMGDYSFALAYDHDELLANDSISAHFGATFGDVAAQVYIADSDAFDTSYGVYAAYTMGALTLSAEYADSDAVVDAAYGIGASYDLGGGAALAGGVGVVSDDTVADLGLTFKF